ncbi:hypothetical protein RHGRI_001624 [Rhododendron griersonianum]|uniref:Uncharacterized protein n=1 Tax=Rhododendron griersonianum TaxID=479676 RepID=A0AAV6KLC6_9ERIC|nr:hypothetical protein RHGRI_034119 [Rhododendron griersonianum]KAG5536394.1 hypothetical protein RHGRI_023983 [Rhododendron griersonianum]KAG5540749.1 hypothetical protein RHGRI_020852 [Rhododendron griersonianum]KAG5544383.1 hypothetical protein RHGRI_016961 [Rhododendron griersonianum]KAG5544384.1 hypothetical protein RHGRI_016962 [Rhododendron griersonianum]
MAISAAPEVLAPAVSSAVSCNAMGQARVEISDSNPCQKWVLNRSQYRGLVFNRGSPVSVAGGGSIVSTEARRTSCGPNESSAGSGHGYTRAGPSVEVHNYPNRGTPTWLPDKYPGSQNFSDPEEWDFAGLYQIIKLPVGQATGDIKLLVALAAGKGFVPVGGTCSGGKPSVLLMAGAVLFICWG